MLNVEEVLENLVKFNTIKDKENKEILDYIENTLISMGFKTEKRDKFLIQIQLNLLIIGNTINLI